jgi:hypothetical protein
MKFIILPFKGVMRCDCELPVAVRAPKNAL